MTATKPAPRFTEISPTRPADELEREIIARWQEEKLFERTLHAHDDAPSFVFFEGPPTANGRPGIHHVFSRTLKDLFCRYRAAKGFHVLRKAGWDTHGLPVEIEWAQDDQGFTLLQARPLHLQPAHVPDDIWLRHPRLNGHPAGIDPAGLRLGRCHRRVFRFLPGQQGRAARSDRGAAA